MGTKFSRPLRVICDSGAQINVIIEQVVKEFKIVRSATTTYIKGLDGKLARTKGEVELELWHNQVDKMITRAKFVVLLDPMSDHPQRSFRPEQFSKVTRRDLADPQYFEQGRIDAIIGVGILANHIREGIQRNSAGLLAQNTSFGWIVSGEGLLPEPGNKTKNVGLIVKDDIRVLMQKLWEIDEMNEKVLSAEDQYCEDNFRSTFVKTANRYSVTIPLKLVAELGNSRAMALRRFYCQENKFKRDPIYKKLYIEFMTEYEKLGHIRRPTNLNPMELLYIIIYLIMPFRLIVNLELFLMGLRELLMGNH